MAKRFPVLFVAALAAFAILASGAPPTTINAAEEEPAGLKVFNAEKCGMCHDVSSAGIKATTKSESMKGTDLTGVTSRHEAEWIGKFIRQEIELDGVKHKKAYKGTDEDLAALIEWLDTQK